MPFPNEENKVSFEFINYFDEVELQVQPKAKLTNEQAKLLTEKLFYRNVITERGYINTIRELGFYA